LSPLERANAEPSRLKAYALFDAFLIGDHDLSGPLTEYLRDPQKRHREALLGCMADREVELGPALREPILGLLEASDDRTRRMAALALASGGPAAEEALSEALGQLPSEVAEDLKETLRLAFGV
jgi:hypothetical protein